jgi:hypothetical protein
VSAVVVNFAHDRHRGYGGSMRWITTNSHKDIGTRYLVFGLTMLVVGFCNAAYEILSNLPGSPRWS